jgi:hypothetical protein
MNRPSNAPLHISVQDGTSPLRIALSGDLDERADLGVLGAQTAPRLTFDLANLTRINSIGVRRWVHALEAMLAKPNVKIVLTRCSPAFVTQALMIANMVDGVRIESLFVSYWCDRCTRNEDVLIEAGQTVKLTLTCPTCRQPFEADPSLPLIADLLRAHG